MLTTGNTEFLNKEITQAVIAAAICVHKNLGPGLLESALVELKAIDHLAASQSRINGC